MSSETKQMLIEQIEAQADQFDAIYEAEDPYEELFEAPLEIIVGRSLTVVLCAGGPHVEAVATLGSEGDVTSARIDGYWGGARVSRSVRTDSSLWRALGDYAECIEVNV